MRILLLSIALLFSACSLTQPDASKDVQKSKKDKLQISLKQKDKAKTKKPESKPMLKKEIPTMFRGYIVSQSLDANTKRWTYKLRLADMTMEKKRYKSFSYAKKVHKLGDLIYVVFYKKNPKIVKDIFLIKAR